MARPGVDVDGVEVDPRLPTGLYVKDPAPEGSGVLYYRRGSAASVMSTAEAEHVWSRKGWLVHLSGITPALSAEAAALVEHLLDPRAGNGELRSFDVNHRPALWSARDAGPVLLDLARRADVVFVGRDEAERLWGALEAVDVRAALPEVPTLVVKDAEHGATCFEGGGEDVRTRPAGGRGGSGRCR